MNFLYFVKTFCFVFVYLVVHGWDAGRLVSVPLTVVLHKTNNPSPHPTPATPNPLDRLFFFQVYHPELWTLCLHAGQVLVRFSDSLALGASGLGNLTICCLASVFLSHIRVIQISRPLSEIPGQGDGVQREVRGVGGGRQGPGRLPPLEQRRGPREAQLEPKLRLCRPRLCYKLSNT